MKKLLVLLVLIAFITIPAQAKKDAAWVARKVKISEDTFSKTTSVNFPLIKYYTLGNADIVKMTGKSKWGIIPSVSYNIEMTEKAGERSFVLLAGETRSGWAFYDSAKDNDGNELKVVRPAGDVSSYSAGVQVEEYFNIPLTEEYLKQHAESGMVFRVYGKKDTLTFHVPDWYIQGIFQYLNPPEATK